MRLTATAGVFLSAEQVWAAIEWNPTFPVYDMMSESVPAGKYAKFQHGESFHLVPMIENGLMVGGSIRNVEERLGLDKMTLVHCGYVLIGMCASHPLTRDSVSLYGGRVSFTSTDIIKTIKWARDRAKEDAVQSQECRVQKWCKTHKT